MKTKVFIAFFSSPVFYEVSSKGTYGQIKKNELNWVTTQGPSLFRVLKYAFYFLTGLCSLNPHIAHSHIEAENVHIYRTYSYVVGLWPEPGAYSCAVAQA